MIPNDGSPNVTEARLYVDGVEESYESSVSRAINTGTTNDVRIGNSPFSSRPFNGNLDDVRIYDTDLTAAHVLELYKQGRR